MVAFLGSFMQPKYMVWSIQLNVREWGKTEKPDLSTIQSLSAGFTATD